MTTEAITTAIRSVLGDFTSPDTAAALSAALRPIHGEEAAHYARIAMVDDRDADELTCSIYAAAIRKAMCQKGASDA